MDLKNAFNGAAGYTGAVVSTFGLWLAFITPTPLNVGMVAGGALLFSAGFTNFFGSGKTARFLKTQLDNAAPQEVNAEPVTEQEAEEAPNEAPATRQDSKLMTSFNVATSYAGGALTSTSGFIYMVNSVISGIYGSGYEPTTGQTLAYLAVAAAGAGMYSVGHNRFFGSGKTLNATRALVDKIQPNRPQGPN